MVTTNSANYATGAAATVLTGNGVGVTPTFQAASGGGISTLAGTSGSATGSTVTLAKTATEGTYTFTGSGATITARLTDANQNLGLCLNNDFHALAGGGSNLAIGQDSLYSITSGTGNIGLGIGCVALTTTGGHNLGIGNNALFNLVTGSYNLAWGYTAGTAYTGAESSNILIQNVGVAAESHTIRIGTAGTGDRQQSSCYIAGITGVTVTGAAVLCSATGLLGTVVSSEKYKDDIQDIGDNKFLNLRPVSFHYKTDDARIRSYGMIAEEVEKLCPELVLYRDGKPDSLKYHEMPALLLAEIQKQKNTIDMMIKRIEALESKLGL